MGKIEKSERKVKTVNEYWFAYLIIFLVGIISFVASFFLHMNDGFTEIGDIFISIVFFILSQVGIGFLIYIIEGCSMKISKKFTIFALIFVLLSNIMAGLFISKTAYFFVENTPIESGETIGDLINSQAQK